MTQAWTGPRQTTDCLTVSVGRACEIVVVKADGKGGVIMLGRGVP
jgi:hypothetical protein